MSILDMDKLISSKEILEKTEISRATLNNYIKMGIIPRPIVQSPREDLKDIRKIGYFPETVIDRINTVKKLKKEGYSMENIAMKFIDMQIDENEEDEIESRLLFKDGMSRERGNSEKIHAKDLRLHIEEISFPAYLLNYDFEIAWINKDAEEKILKQNIMIIEDVGQRNIFKLFFNWEFHSLIKNWKDLVIYHMSFAKAKFSKTWLAKLYRGISKREIQVLEKIYDVTSIFQDQIIKDTNINLLMKDGSTKRYRVFSMFFREGTLFVYIPIEKL